MFYHQCPKCGIVNSDNELRDGLVCERIDKSKPSPKGKAVKYPRLCTDGSGNPVELVRLDPDIVGDKGQGGLHAYATPAEIPLAPEPLGFRADGTPVYDDEEWWRKPHRPRNNDQRANDKRALRKLSRFFRKRNRGPGAPLTIGG